MPAQHKTELSKELYFKTVTFNFIITFLIFFSLCLNIMPWTTLSSCQCNKCWKSECFTPQCFALAQPLGLHDSVFAARYCLRKRAFLGAAWWLACPWIFKMWEVVGRFNSMSDNQANPSGWAAFGVLRSRSTLLPCLSEASPVKLYSFE